jgi:hypothetical protein
MAKLGALPHLSSAQHLAAEKPDEQRIYAAPAQ